MINRTQSTTDTTSNNKYYDKINITFEAKINVCETSVEIKLIENLK